MTSGFSRKCEEIWQSFRALPRWVQVWVGGVLVPVNGISVLMLDTWTGTATAWAALFVVATNVPLMFITGGMSKALSIPHIIAWAPLWAVLAIHWPKVQGGSATTGAEAIYLPVVLLVNGTSLVFDVFDSFRWWQGDKAVPGHANITAGDAKP